MSTVVQGILLAVIGVLLFGLIIFIHEFGHFFTAKLSHVCVNEFSIGMGPKLFSFTRGETQYSLRLLPIGGFCPSAATAPWRVRTKKVTTPARLATVPFGSA